MFRASVLKSVATTCSLLLLCVGGALAKDIPVALADVPEVVRAAAVRALPDFVAEDAELEASERGGRHYELEGRADGVQYEIEILPDGQVVSIEREGEEEKKFEFEAESRSDVRPRTREEPETAVVQRRDLPKGPPGAAAPITVGTPEVVALPSTESEIVSVYRSAAGGDGVAVTSPAESCGGHGDDSELVVLDAAFGAALTRAPADRIATGRGEVTSVAAHPHGAYFLAAAKDGTAPNTRPGRVLLLRDGRVESTLRVGIGPDSVAISPDGAWAVVACEASQPEADECEAEADASDTGGSIHVLDLTEAPARLSVVAVIDAAAILARFPSDAADRVANAREIEPEYAAIGPDSSVALVTLQEQSAVAVLDLAALRAGGPRERASVLACVVALPHGFRDRDGVQRGAHPDAVAFSPDGSFALTANEAHPRARQFQGVSVIDLRAGPRGATLAATHSIFDLDPTLLEGASGRQPPRLDPEGVAIGSAGGVLVAAIAIERRARGEESGSVLFLDVTEALAGALPPRLARRLVGRGKGARPEGIAMAHDARFVYVATERDGGALTRIALAPRAAFDAG